MGLRGPPPDRREQKVIRGTFRSDRDNPDRPEPEVVDDIDPPPTLDMVGTNCWLRMTTELAALNLLATTDFLALERYCMLYSKMRIADLALLEHGLTYETVDQLDNTLVKKRPEADLVAKYAAELRQMENTFGLNPAARERVRSSSGPAAGNNPRKKPTGLLRSG